MMRPWALITAAALGFATGVVLWSAGNASRGEQLFSQMCTGCHGLDAGKEGPRLRGVFGRAAAPVIART